MCWNSLEEIFVCLLGWFFVWLIVGLGKEKKREERKYFDLSILRILLRNNKLYNLSLRRADNIDEWDNVLFSDLRYQLY